MDKLNHEHLTLENDVIRFFVLLDEGMSIVDARSSDGAFMSKTGSRIFNTIMKYLREHMTVVELLEKHYLGITHEKLDEWWTEIIQLASNGTRPPVTCRLLLEMYTAFNALHKLGSLRERILNDARKIDREAGTRHEIKKLVISSWKDVTFEFDSQTQFVKAYVRGDHYKIINPTNLKSCYFMNRPTTRWHNFVSLVLGEEVEEMQRSRVNESLADFFSLPKGFPICFTSSGCSANIPEKRKPRLTADTNDGHHRGNPSKVRNRKTQPEDLAEDHYSEITDSSNEEEHGYASEENNI